MQEKLSRLKSTDSKYYYTGALDGLFGSGTKTAVRLFQKDNSTLPMTEDGIAGKITLQNLDIADIDQAYCNVYGSEVSSSYLQSNANINEISLLARLIYAENTGSVPAQRNIAYVVWSRTQDARFPNDYHGVARQSGQWSVITGPNGAHINARKPPRTHINWRNAVIIAKKLVEGTRLPGELYATCKNRQLYAGAASSPIPAGALNIVSEGDTVCYNRP